MIARGWRGRRTEGGRRWVVGAVAVAALGAALLVAQVAEARSTSALP